MSNDGVMLFEQDYKEDILSKTFDVSKLPTGIYFFEVATKDDSEYFTVVR